MDKISYSLGLSIANNFRASGIEKIELEDFLAGFKAVMQEQTPEISYEEAQQIMNDYFNELGAKQIQRNKEAGEEFLKINAKKDGVVTLPSGLQYEILTEGKGDKPKASDKVRCHYHGTLINGNVFDSSIDRGQPAEFPVNGVIKGWQEVLQLMPVGSKWRVTIPQELAYGAQGAGRDIMPYSALVFIIELLEIK